MLIGNSVFTPKAKSTKQLRPYLPGDSCASLVEALTTGKLKPSRLTADQLAKFGGYPCCLFNKLLDFEDISTVGGVAFQFLAISG